MKHYSTVICLAITLLSQHALSQAPCDLGAGFLYETDPGGETTFTAFSSGGTNVGYEWTINGIGYGSDPEITENVTSGDVVCVKVYSYTYENDEIVGYCYDLHCETVCVVQAGFSQSTGSNGETTFTAFSSGAANVTYEWTINGIGAGSDPGITETVAPGDVVCVKVYAYDENDEPIASCSALYCETICVPAGFVYTNNVLDEMILSAYSFGNPNVGYSWTINGIGYGSDPEFGVELEPGDVVCLTVYSYEYEGEELVEVCSYTYCRTISAERAAGKETRLSVHPNPARTVISANAEHCTFEVLDMNGRVLLRGNDAASIDVSGLLRGVYGLRVIDPVTGSGKTVRFVKE